MGSTFDGDLYVAGVLAARTTVQSDGSVSDDSVVASAGIKATKLEHQHALTYHQVDGGDVVSAIVPLYTVRGATATIVAIEVSCLDSPSGGNKKFTVDLKKATVAIPTPASVLSAVIDYANATPDCTVLAGTINLATLVDGDVLVVEITASGSTGVQGQGLQVTVTVREDAQ
jgi:hypothetical protein